MVACASGALDENTTMLERDAMVERNLKVAAFIPSDCPPTISREDPSTDLFVHPALMLAEQYINDGLKLYQGDRTRPLKVNISVDCFRSGVS